MKSSESETTCNSGFGLHCCYRIRVTGDVTIVEAIA